MADDDSKKPRPLIERRQAFAERMSAKAQGPFAGREPQGSGPPNREGMPRVPVGQRVVEKWPVLDLGDVPMLERSQWRLTVDGLVEEPHTYTWEELMALPQVSDVSDFHCVTGWSRLNNHWQGVRVSELAARARLKPEVAHVLIEAYDHAPGTRTPYTTNVSLAEAMKDDVLLVHTWEGKPLPREHGGPLRMITPQLYAWKGAKWIKRITFLAGEQRGYWELRGYSNTAYPWFDDRYRYD